MSCSEWVVTDSSTKRMISVLFARIVFESRGIRFIGANLFLLVMILSMCSVMSVRTRNPFEIWLSDDTGVCSSLKSMFSTCVFVGLLFWLVYISETL